MANPVHDDIGQQDKPESGLGEDLNPIQSLKVKIGQLEASLRQKDSALSQSLDEQVRLRSHLQDHIRITQVSLAKVARANGHYKSSVGQLLAHMEGLERELSCLQGANDAWANRAIKLGIEVVSAKTEAKSVRLALDLAVIRIAELEKALKTFTAT
jgi:chromosome segregation ATPase